MTINDIIDTSVMQKTALSFKDFMHIALYDPHTGYYSSNKPKIGARGDFITAPELTPLFGQTLAHQCLQVFQTINQPDILEFGAGNGQLCIDILSELERLSALPEHYYILDVSGGLKQTQKDLIKARIPHLADKVIWLNSWPEKPIKGVMLANEVLDAMPVERIIHSKDGFLQSHIKRNEQGNLEEYFLPLENQLLIDQAARIYPPNKIPYVSEINPYINEWIKGINNALVQGAVFLIDYGFPCHEYYHPDRDQGTLMCHYQHQAHANPLAHPGEEDITAHVDFTHVAEAAVDAGLHVAGFTSQASFLLSNDLLNLLEAIENDHERLKENQAVKTLVQPSEMGELFKVIALTKAIDYPLNGFTLQDRRASL